MGDRGRRARGGWAKVPSSQLFEEQGATIQYLKKWSNIVCGKFPTKLQKANKSEQIYTSHDIANCKFLNKEEKSKLIRAAARLLNADNDSNDQDDDNVNDLTGEWLTNLQNNFRKRKETEKIKKITFQETKVKKRKAQIIFREKYTFQLNMSPQLQTTLSKI